MPLAPIGDIDVYYEVAGAGDPLVLVMGLGGDLQAWALQVPALAQHFRVITFDNRGAGRSGAPDRRYTIPAMAADLARLLDCLQLERVRLLGWSMGGYIAQEFARLAPERVGRLILLATAPFIDGFGRQICRTLIDVHRSNLSPEQLARFTATWLYSAEFFEDPARLERSIRIVMANRWPQQDHGFIRQAEAILAWRPGDAAKQLTQPALVVAGRDDILVPPRNSERLAALIPGARLEVLPGAHAGCLEHPELYNQLFLDFLSG
jgi:pimeloyl-ACP methyl ester carboxylesterase